MTMVYNTMYVYRAAYVYHCYDQYNLVRNLKAKFQKTFYVRTMISVLKSLTYISIS